MKGPDTAPVLGVLEGLIRLGRSSRYGAARHAALNRRGYESWLASPSPSLRGRAARILGKEGEARVAFKEAIRSEASLGRAWAWRWELEGGGGLDRAVELEPKDLWWRSWRALDALSRAKPGRRPSRAGPAARALKDAERALEADAGCALALVAAAMAEDFLARPRRALARLDTAVSSEPRQAWIRRYRGNVRLFLGDEAGFLADAEEALLCDEGTDHFRKLLAARGLLRRPSRASRFPLMDDHFCNVLGSSNDSRELVEAAGRCLAAEPRAYWAYVLRGNRRRTPEINDFDGAVSDLERAAELRPDCAWVWAHLGRAYVGRSERASAAMARAQALAPECGWISAWRGEFLRRGGDLRGALSALDRGLALDPDYEVAYGWRGAARRSSGDVAGALEDLDLAVALEPANAWALQERSLARRAGGRLGAALEDLEAACRRDPKFSWYRRPADAEGVRRDLDAAVRQDGADARARAWRGELKVRLGDWAGAKEDLDAAVALSPGYALAHAWLGLGLEGLGRPRQAARALSESIRLDPRYANAFVWRARVLSSLGLRARASRDLARAVALDPKSAWAWKASGEAAYLGGRFRAAARAFTQALALHPAYAEARLSRAEAWSRLGRKERAEKDLAAILEEARRLRAGGRHGEAAALCGLALERFPDHAATLVERSEARRCLNDVAAALADRDRLVALRGDASSLVDRGELRRRALNFKGAARDAAAALALEARAPGAWMLKAEAARGLGFWEEAVAAATRAAALDPAASWPLVVRAKAKRQGGDLDGAASDLARATALEPADAKAWAWLGEARRKQGDPGAARRALERALERDGNCAWARALLGEILRELGDAAGCLAQVQSAARLDDSCSAAYDFLGSEPPEVRQDPAMAWIYAWRGAAARRRGLWARARRDLRRALTLDPRCFWARAWAGELELARGRPKPALGFLEGASAVLRDAEILVWRGRALCALGRCDAAERCFAQALRRRPGDPWALIAAGVCAERRGRSRRALERFSRARRAAPTLFKEAVAA